MKTKIKRVFSIFLILCLTLTMIPGTALVGFAVEEPYHYECNVNFDGNQQEMLPNGSTLTAYTSLEAYYEWGADIPEYTIDVTLTPDDQSDEDLLTCQVENDIITFTSNDQGATGTMLVKIDFIVNGEIVGEYETDVRVSTTVYDWPDWIDTINPEHTTIPLVGEPVNLAAIAVEEHHYDNSTGEVTTRTLTNDTEGILIEQDYDGGWEPADSNNTEGICPLVRTSDEECEIMFTLYEYDEAMDEYNELSGNSYIFGAHDYEVYFVDCPIEAWEEETAKEVVVDKNALMDKPNTEVVVELGYETETDYGFGFVAFDNQTELFTSSEDEQFIRVTINPAKLAALDVDREMLRIRASVVAAGYDVSETIEVVTIKEPYVEYDFGYGNKMLLTNEWYYDFEVGCYYENADSPEGSYAYLPITNVEVLSGQGTVIDLKNNYDNSQFIVSAVGLGTAELEITHETLEGGTTSFVETIEVVEAIYYTNLVQVSPTFTMIPGGMQHVVDVTVDCETSDDYIEDIAVDIEWDVQDPSYSQYITFKEDSNDSGLFTIAANADAPINEEDSWLTLICTMYEVDNEGNRIKDENNADIVIAEEEYQVELRNEIYYVELEGFDSYAEVGESQTVTPKMKHAYINEAGQYVEGYADVDSWEFDVYSEGAASVTDNEDGTFTIKRLEYYDIEFYVRSYIDDREEGTNFIFEFIDYNVSFDYDKHYIVEGGTTTVYVNEDQIGQKDYVAYEWSIEYYDQELMDYVVLDPAEGYYTVAEDNKSITIDGTKIYELGLDSIDVCVIVNSEVDGESYEVHGNSEMLPIFGADDELPFGDPDEYTAAEFLALADENGNIKLTNNVMLLDALVIDDGKTYTIDLNGLELYGGEEIETFIKVTNGTLNVVSGKIDKEYDQIISGCISSDGEYALVIDGKVGEAVVNLSEYVYVIGYKPILVNGGTLNSAAGVSEYLDEGETLDEIIVSEGADVQITLTGGYFINDYTQYIPDTHTKHIDAWYTDETETEVMSGYDIIEKPADVDEAVQSGLLFVGEDGYYYFDQNSADLLGVTATRIGYRAEVIVTDENGEVNIYNETVSYYYSAKVGMSIKEAVEWYEAELVLPQIEGYHLDGWYVFDWETDTEWTDDYASLVITVTGTEKYATDEAIYEDVSLVSVWCNSTETEVVGKVEATQISEGYTGDTVCKECGALIEKGTVTEKVVVVEEGKVEITEETVDKAIADAVEEETTEVVIPLGDTTEAVKEVELPVASVETIIDAGKNLTVETKEATVTLDTKALETVAAEAEGQTIVLVVEEIADTELSTEQKEAVEDLEVELIISAEIICAQTQNVISGDFGGGKATVKLPFEVPTGEDADDYSVVYIGDDGTVEDIDTEYIEGHLVFQLEHFSEYAIIKNKTLVNPFTDVAESDWFYDEVLWAVDKGITAGMSATEFAPGNDCTRAQVVAFLWRAAGRPDATIDSCPFTDLDPQQYYMEALLWAYEKGIVAGTTATTFSPNDTVTRAQFVTFLWRMEGRQLTTNAVPFTDLDANAYYVDAIKWAYDNEIAAGMTETTFQPDSTCTRAQVVSFIYRAFK